MTALALAGVVALCLGIVMWREFSRPSLHLVDVERWR